MYILNVSSVVVGPKKQDFQSRINKLKGNRCILYGIFFHLSWCMPKEPLNLSTGILLSLLELRLGSKGKAIFRNVKKGM